jgi:HTH-type transcriptional regulator / antitoxin HigA
MKTPPIESEEEYDRALDRLVALMEAAPGSQDAQERESLLEAIEDYEEEHYPLEPLGGKGNL